MDTAQEAKDFLLNKKNFSVYRHGDHNIRMYMRLGKNWFDNNKKKKFLNQLTDYCAKGAVTSNIGKVKNFIDNPLTKDRIYTFELKFVYRTDVDQFLIRYKEYMAFIGGD